MPEYIARIKGEFELVTSEGKYSFETNRTLSIEALDYNEALDLANEHINHESPHLTTSLESLVSV